MNHISTFRAFWCFRNSSPASRPDSPEKLPSLFQPLTHGCGIRVLVVFLQQKKTMNNVWKCKKLVIFLCWFRCMKSLSSKHNFCWITMIHWSGTQFEDRNGQAWILHFLHKCVTWDSSKLMLSTAKWRFFWKFWVALNWILHKKSALEILQTPTKRKTKPPQHLVNYNNILSIDS